MERDKDGVVGTRYVFINEEQSFFFCEQSDSPFPNQPSVMKDFPLKDSIYYFIQKRQLQDAGLELHISHTVKLQF